MGKLSDLWQQYRNMDSTDPRRKDIQDEINKVERWMIAKGYKTDGETKWGALEGKSELYPFHTGAVYFEDIKQVASLNGKGINYNKDNSIHICPLDL